MESGYQELRRGFATRRNIKQFSSLQLAGAKRHGKQCRRSWGCSRTPQKILFGQNQNLASPKTFNLLRLWGKRVWQFITGKTSRTNDCGRLELRKWILDRNYKLTKHSRKIKTIYGLLSNPSLGMSVQFAISIQYPHSTRVAPTFHNHLFC